MKCKNCIKWYYPRSHANGTFGLCIKNKYWCNENYYCTTREQKKKEGNL